MQTNVKQLKYIYTRTLTKEVIKGEMNVSFMYFVAGDVISVLCCIAFLQKYLISFKTGNGISNL